MLQVDEIHGPSDAQPKGMYASPLHGPAVHYAYHPCDDALLSVHEYVGRGWKLPQA